uniref:Peptidase A2 domain-containing protein n=1 Tax=Nothobranchius kuhntae TaxID=321403 RepID=A0A1A8IVJ0_NOTKU
MEQFRPLSPLGLVGNLSEAWRRWEQRFQLYMIATGASEKEEEVKIAILLHTIGEEALEVYNTLNITPAGDALTVEEVLKAFKTYCSPQKNVVFERHQFWSYPMSPGIVVDRYITELRQKSKDCEFGPNVDDMIRDKLVFSINDSRLKERLLHDKDLTLNKAIEICRSAEAAKTQIQAMQLNPVVQDASVDTLKKTPHNLRPGQGRIKASNKQTVCTKCGIKHEPRKCPAYGEACLKCKKKNHFSKLCRSNIDKDKPYTKTKMVNNLEADTDTLYIGVVSSDKNETNCWKETVTIRKVPIVFKLDTGADANVLPMQVYHKIPGPVQLRSTKTVLIAFGGARISAEGIVSLECVTSKGSAVLDFLVSRQADKAILGGQACEELQLVKRVDVLTPKSHKLDKLPATKEELVEKYAEVFTGVGEFPGLHHIYIDPEATPVIHACRSVPLSIMDSDLYKRH